MRGHDVWLKPDGKMEEVLAKTHAEHLLDKHPEFSRNVPSQGLFSATWDALAKGWIRIVVTDGWASVQSLKKLSNQKVRDIAFDAWVFLKSKTKLRNYTHEWGPQNRTQSKTWTDAVESLVESLLRESLEQKAVKEFGITNDPREAGYILANGDWLDMSGKNEGGPAGTRSFDHRNISRVMSGGGGSDGMFKFMARGNIRLHYSNGTAFLDIMKKPTPSQQRSIKDLASYDMIVDITNRQGKTMDTLEVDRGEAQYVLSWIAGHFR